MFDDIVGSAVTLKTDRDEDGDTPNGEEEAPAEAPKKIYTPQDIEF